VVPYGILDVMSGLFAIFFGTSHETSDFIVDCIEAWWKTNESLYSHIMELVINLDNGPNNASGRTQFVRRMVEFSEKTGLRIRLLYYPPYHSKYNPVERCWGILEEHWNGEILDSISKTIEWAATMTWKGVKPVVKLVEKTYEKGIKLTKQEMEKYEKSNFSISGGSYLRLEKTLALIALLYILYSHGDYLRSNQTEYT
jgi:transposase